MAKLSVTLPSIPPKPQTDILVSRIPDGEIFIGNIKSTRVNTLFMKIYGHIFEVKQPNHTWTDEIIIYDYRPVMRADLVITL